MATNPNLQKIIKLTASQYETLSNGGSITYQGVTYTGLNDNYLYLIQEDGITRLTYSALKTLRNNSKLTPGSFYRITDYECTSSQAGTSSAGHQFDIIVRADDVNKLNEEASAVQHTGDTYFANNNLQAWKIWYCLDNDINRFSWAANGISWIESTASGWSQTVFYRDSAKDEGGYYAFSGTAQQSYSGTIYTNTLILSTTMQLYIKSGTTIIIYTSYSIDNVSVSSPIIGKGIIYRMIDEFNNDAPYDFKNILFTGSSYNSSITYTNAYTFSYTESGIKDASLLASKSCHNNIVKKYIQINKQWLNFNVFYSTSSSFVCFNNTFEVNCYKNTFRDNSTNNVFGKGCYSNTFGNSCYHNTFGTDCYRNTFSDACCANTFGEGCYSNTIGSGSYSNTFGTGCYSNTFNSSCTFNLFENKCNHNTFGTYCSCNTFGNECNNIMLGTSVSALISYVRYITIESGCQYINLSCAESGGAYNNYAQNIHIHSGVSGDSSSNPLPIIIPERNLQHEIEYRMAGSEEITIARPIMIDNAALKTSIGTSAKEIVVNNV